MDDVAFLAARVPKVAPEVWLDAAIVGVEPPRRSWLREGDPAEVLALRKAPWSKA
jgi:hypothetical protein